MLLLDFYQVILRCVTLIISYASLPLAGEPITDTCITAKPHFSKGSNTGLSKVLKIFDASKIFFFGR